MILVTFALKEEAGPFQKIAAGRPGDNVSILLTGIGKRNADKSLRGYLDQNAPDAVLTCGFAGGLAPELKIGDVVFETTDPGLADKISAAGGKRMKFFCADRIATTAAEKEKLRTETGAEVVEMESSVIHAICREREIPCATVRCISDTANEDLPIDFNQYSRPDKSLDMPKLLFAVATSPGKIGALMELQKKAKFASEQLAQVLEKILGDATRA
ncbi:MAG TPA: hypothetical protein VFV81_02815 [Verrucomicrobiae bacterium]|nr:hypothetical protein [Verrucomicrobiae bacterium]